MIPAVASLASVPRRVRALAGWARVGVAVLCCGPSLPVWCQIYTNAPSGQGAIVLSNFQSEETSVLLVAPPPAPPQPAAVAATAVNAVPRTTVAAPTAEMRQMIDAVGRQTEVSSSLLHAVIAVESQYNPRAVSNKGAVGLMQLLPSTGKRFGAGDLFAPKDNVVAGAQYLKWLMGLFDQDLELVLAAYNAGEQAVIRAGGKIPPFPETQAYVKKVMANLRRAAAPAT